MKQRIIEVCPALPMFSHFNLDHNWIVVVADVLRATTTICTAFDYGAEKIIPVATTSEAVEFKRKGYFVAGERNGLKLDFADAGNSPLQMMHPEIRGKTIVLTTTNGTQAIRLATGKTETVIGAFINLNVLKDWILARPGNVMVLCAGWENLLGLEDVLFAGALTEALLKTGEFGILSDEATLACDLWQLAKNDLLTYITKVTHTKRLIAAGQAESLEYCFTIGISTSVPVMIDGTLQQAFRY